MDRYIDEKYTILDGTLLACRLRGEHLTIPSSVNGHEIKKIGKGVRFDEKASSISFEEGITGIGEGVITVSMIPVAKSLHDVYFPESMKSYELDFVSSRIFANRGFKFHIKKRLNADEYENICKNSISVCNGKRRLLDSSLTNAFVFDDIMAGMGLQIGFPRFIAQDMCGIYMLGEGGGILSELPFTGRRSYIGCAGLAKVGEFRKKAVGQMLKERTKPLYSSDSELTYDKKLQRKRATDMLNVDFVLLATFGESDVEQMGDGVRINFSLDIGAMFFTGLSRVVYSGRDFYIYREYYLTTNDKLPFEIRDYPECVYDAYGEEVSAAIAKTVAGKYKLASMLV
ncbi:MAG: hypothetical protein IKO61_06125 [Lachnospiraceae bacterium]|nr:hypothetical protein [Lachnospiraceae bacterium]